MIKSWKRNLASYFYLTLWTIAELLIDGGVGLEVVGLLVQLEDVELEQLVACYSRLLLLLLGQQLVILQLSQQLHFR